MLQRSGTWSCTYQIADRERTYGATSEGVTWEPPAVHGSCPGSLIVHLIDGTPAGCTLDEDGDGCAGIELRHEADPMSRVREWGGCNHCGVHQRSFQSRMTAPERALCASGR